MFHVCILECVAGMYTCMCFMYTNLNVFYVCIIECVSCMYADMCLMCVYLNVFNVCELACVSCIILTYVSYMYTGMDSMCVS